MKNQIKLLLLGSALLVSAVACSKKSSGNPVPVPEVCATLPANCVSGQSYNQGVYLATGLSQLNITADKTMEVKLAVYARQADEVRKNSSGIIIYEGNVFASGTASVVVGQQFAGRVNSRNTCKIPAGEYTVSALDEGYWMQDVRNRVNVGEIDQIKLHFSNGVNSFDADLDYGEINFRSTNATGFKSLNGTLSIAAVDGVRCSTYLDL